MGCIVDAGQGRFTLHRVGSILAVGIAITCSYESRNESRHGIFGIFGGVLNIDKRIENLSSQTKRWTYGGRPTRKARRIYALQRRMEAYDRIWRTGAF